MYKDIWHRWAESKAADLYSEQWLLSKWETIQGVVWPREKITIMIDDIQNKLELKPEHCLIDVGCGGGWIAQELHRHCQTVFALDFAPGMLEAAAQSRFDIQLILGDAWALPISSGGLDRSLIYFMLMNYPDREKIAAALKECLRVLKPGGICLAGQFPLKSGTQIYLQEKKRYLEWCKSKFKLGNDFREEQPHPQVLFEDDFGEYLRNALGVQVRTEPSFNHFWRQGEPAQCRGWRVDYILNKNIV